MYKQILVPVDLNEVGMAVGQLMWGLASDKFGHRNTLAAGSYGALVVRANIKKGDYVLIHAAAGGVGLAAVQGMRRSTHCVCLS